MRKPRVSPSFNAYELGLMSQALIMRMRNDACMPNGIRADMEKLVRKLDRNLDKIEVKKLLGKV